MNARLFIWLLPALWAVFVGALAASLLRAAGEITYVTLADGRRQARALPWLFRWLLPFAPNVTRRLHAARWDRAKQRVARRLEAAGFGGLLAPDEFIALRLLLPLLPGVLLAAAIALVAQALPGRLGAALTARAGLFGALALAGMAALPDIWLRRAVAERHVQIRAALPFVLDLLTLSVEAGLDFMTAIKRIVERRPLDALNEELIRVFREVQIGRTRRDALRDLADRADQSDLRAVVHALVQADELGVGIGVILRIQAEQMRVRRYQLAEKAANEAPVRMLAPLMLFIFPAVFIVLLGPILLQVLRQGF